jgi:hypothetical protein
MRRPLAVLLLVAALAALGACGGHDSAKTSSDAAPTSTTPTGFTGKDSEEFCKLARTYSAKIRVIGANVTNPAQLKNVLAEVEPAVSKAVDEAPSEIKSDIEYLAKAFKQIRTSLDKGEQLDVALISDPQFQTSADRVSRYGVEVCGIQP